MTEVQNKQQQNLKILMNQYRESLKQCLFGLKCKYGLSCKYYHPQEQCYQNNYFLKKAAVGGNIQMMQNHLIAMSLSQTAINHGSGQIDNQVIDDASYQQRIYQGNYKRQTDRNLNKHSTLCDKVKGNQQMEGSFKIGGQIKQIQEGDVKEPTSFEKVGKFFQKNQIQSNTSDQFAQQSDQNQSDSQNQKSLQNRDAKRHKINPLLAQDKIKKQNKKQYKLEFKKKSMNSQSFQQYQGALKEFFDRRHVKPHKRQAIYGYLAKQIAFQSAVVETILPMVEKLEIQGFTQYFCYKKLFKTICKQNFQIQAVKLKLIKKISIVQKRRNKYIQLNTRFPNPVNVEFLQSKDLLQNEMNNKNTIYLIDGNNCMITQKHLRFYFQQKHKQSKAEAQIRFRWLVSLVVRDSKRCFIFFDDKFEDKVYSRIASDIMSQAEYKQVINSTTVIYAHKDKEADDAMRDKLQQLTKGLSQKQLSNILLITADRILVQQCYQIHHLKKSSGMYFIKFNKKYIRQSSKHNPFMKKIIKRILNYGN